MSWLRRLKGLLWRVPRFERRWIADPEERDEHERVVRTRLGIRRRKKPRP